jgi:hypothetical protein
MGPEDDRETSGNGIIRKPTSQTAGCNHKHGHNEERSLREVQQDVARPKRPRNEARRVRRLQLRCADLRCRAAIRAVPGKFGFNGEEGGQDAE